MNIGALIFLSVIGLGALLIIGWIVYKIWQKWPSFHPVAMGLKLIVSAIIIGFVAVVIYGVVTNPPNF